LTDRTKVFIELAAATAALFIVIVLVRYAGLHFQGWEASTFIAIPAVAAILLNLPVSELGIVFQRPLADLKLFGLACLIFLPAFAGGYFVYMIYAFNARFVLRFPPEFGRALVDHYLYFALSEELLFRGYMQERLGKVLPRVFKILWFELPLAGIVCAALFAVAHVVYEPDASRLLVFFPALVYAWLRYKTGSILAPVLFHGTCNITEYAARSMFCLMA
jgi:membrane protease YdiL (CAAX protease family)